MAKKPNQRTRTYARNRRALSRQGRAKPVDSDGIFLAKLLFFLLIGLIWLRLQNQYFSLPIGGVMAILLVRLFQHDSYSRQLSYVVVIIACLISFFLPIGLVL